MDYSSKSLIKQLREAGWVLKRCNGSHHQYTKNGRIVTVPHPRKDLKYGTYNAILKQSGLK